MLVKQFQNCSGSVCTSETPCMRVCATAEPSVLCSYSSVPCSKSGVFVSCITSRVGCASQVGHVVHT